MRRRLAGLCVLLLAGCGVPTRVGAPGPGGGVADGGTAVSLARIDLTAPAPIRAGTTARLTATFVGSNGAPLPPAEVGKVTWTSADPAIATVDGTGRLTAIRIGTATVTATSGGVFATLDVPIRSGWFKGALGTVYLFPTSILGGARGPDPNQPPDTADNTWWIRSFASFAASRSTDLELLRKNFADHPRIELYVYFPVWLADQSYHGKYLAELDLVVHWFFTHGIEPVIFFGRPEFEAPGYWKDVKDVTGDPTAERYLLDDIDRTLGYGHIPKDVYLATVYYLGRAAPPGGRQRTEAEVLAYDRAIEKTIHAHGMKFLLHVDEPFWECQAKYATSACGAPPSGSTWWEHGYDPKDIAASAGASDGLFAESRLQGSLVPGIQRLLSEHRFTLDQMLILNDDWNCDVSGNPPCVTGPTSIEKDDATWFQWIHQLGIVGWGVWDFVDGGAGEPDVFGDVEGDGSTLTHKGRLHAAEAAKW